MTSVEGLEARGTKDCVGRDKLLLLVSSFSSSVIFGIHAFVINLTVLPGWQHLRQNLVCHFRRLV